MDEITMFLVFPSGWQVLESKAGSCMARPMRSDFTPWRIGIMLPTSTPRFYDNWASILTNWDSHQLEIPGRKRLEVDHGTPIKAIIA